MSAPIESWPGMTVAPSLLPHADSKAAPTTRRGNDFAVLRRQVRAAGQLERWPVSYLHRITVTEGRPKWHREP